jgi:uncharacterized protein (UPF0262 family)
VEAPAKPDHRIAQITLDERSLIKRSREIEHEREVAVHDLLEKNSFKPKASPGGPYRLVLSIAENRLAFDIALAEGGAHGRILLSLTPFRRMVKDYFAVCESYYAAVRGGRGAQIEAIDMGRRGLHDDGAELLRERLKGKIDVDFDTARRLFTLICVLHMK